jgi:DNA polymerase
VVTKERDGPPAEELVPLRASIGRLRAAAAGCRACRLWRDATQTVFGEGASDARVMFVGEQPGDAEDKAGRPFVGPAGRILDQALAEAGIDRNDVYITNAAKHFKFVRRGKRRIHKKPYADELAACRPWLDAEIRAIKPEVIVALGATAAQALLGRTFKVTQRRGELIRTPIGVVTATVHPSSILRAPNDESRHKAMAEFTSDLSAVAAALRRRSRRASGG